jgi:transcriptional regulator with XRE-family HTH domain
MARAHIKDILLVQFGRRVRALRKAARLSQEKLAFQSDLDRSYIGQIERGECNISLKNIGKLARGLDVAPADLFQFPLCDAPQAAGPDHEHAGA